MGNNIRQFRELEVYKLAMQSAMEIFELTKRFPPEERYSLTDQVRKSSRSVCANIAEAWRKRRYANAFVSNMISHPDQWTIHSVRENETDYA